MARLQGRVAFVTGAGAGIGRAIAADLAREWASVDVADGDAGAYEPRLLASQEHEIRALVTPKGWRERVSRW